MQSLFPQRATPLAGCAGFALSPLFTLAASRFNHWDGLRGVLSSSDSGPNEGASAGSPRSRSFVYRGEQRGSSATLCWLEGPGRFE